MADWDIELLISAAEAQAPAFNVLDLPSTEAIGFAIIAGPVLLTNVESDEALGNVQLNTDVSVEFTGLTSTETFGPCVVAGPVSCTSSTTAELIGNVQVDTQVTLDGLDSNEIVEFSVLTSEVKLSGSSSAQALGVVAATLQAPLSGLNSAELTGNIQVNLAVNLAGIGSVETTGIADVFDNYLGFARVYSICHVRIRYRLDAVTAPTAQWTDGHDPTRHELVQRPAGQRVRLAVVAQTAPITSAIPADPGPYALTRDGITERVVQQTTIVIPPTIVTEIPQGDVITVEPERKSAVRLRGANGRFVKPKTIEVTHATLGKTSGSTVTLKANEGTKVTTKQTKTPTVVKSQGASGPRVRTNKPQNPSTSPTKPRGVRVRTKK